LRRGKPPNMDCKLQHNNLNYNVEIFHEGWNMYKVMLKEWGFLGKKEEEKKRHPFRRCYQA
jgi:hypothetical protein